MKKDQKYFLKRCRLCGRGHNGSLDIFSSKNRNLKELINKCLQINVREDDALPKKICPFCDRKLSLWEKFKNSCESVQVKLIADSLPKKVDIPKIKLRNKLCDGSAYISQISTKDATDDKLLKKSDSKNISRSSISSSSTFQHIKRCDKNDNVLEPKVNNEIEKYKLSSNEQIHSSPALKHNLNAVPEISLCQQFSSKSEEHGNLSEDVLKSQGSRTKSSEITDQDISDLNDTLSKNISTDDSFYTKVGGMNDNSEAFAAEGKLKNSNFTTGPSKKNRKSLKDTENVTRKEYRCVVCSESFSSLRKMKIHCKEHSAQPEEMKNRAKRNPKTELQCPLCPRKLSTNFNLRHHLDTHSETSNYCCHLCGKLFRTRSSLSNHIRVHVCDEMEDQTRSSNLLANSSSVRLFQCEICDKKFRQSGHLAYHLKTHAGIRMYNCGECGLHFTEKYQLRKHENAVHNHVKRYTCDVCGKQFLHTHNFRDHKLQHEGIANVSCDLCGKAFVTNNALSRHQRLHSGEKPFACDICGKKFRDCSNRKRHRDKHVAEEKRGLSTDKPTEDEQNSNLLAVIEEEIISVTNYEKEEVEEKAKKTYMNLKTYFESNDDVSMREEVKSQERTILPIESEVTAVSSQNSGLLQPISNIGNPDDSSNPGPLLGCGLFGEEMDLNAESLLLIGDGRVNNGLIGGPELHGLKDQLVWVSSSGVAPSGDACLNQNEDLEDVTLCGRHVGLPGIQGTEMRGIQGGDITGILEVGMGLCGDFDVTSAIDLDSAKDGLSDDFPSICEIKEVEENEKAFDNVLCLQVF